MKFNADGSLVVCGSSKDGTGEVRVYQSADSKLVAKMEGIRAPIYAVAFQPDSAVVASTGFEGVVYLNETKTGKLIREFVPVPMGK